MICSSCQCHTSPYTPCSVPGGCGSIGCGRTTTRPDISLSERCVLPHKRDEDRPRWAVDGLYVCAGHRRGLAVDLAELPAMHAALSERHTARSGGLGERSAGGHVGLSLNDTVADCRSAIYFSLAGWAKDMAERRNWTLPETDDIRSIGSFVLGDWARNLDWWCSHPAVDEVFKELDPLHSQAFSLLYPSGRRRFEIPDSRCIPVPRNLTAAEDDPDVPKEQIVGGCGEPLMATITDVADLLPSRIWCSGCGIEIAADRWITYGKRLHEAMGRTA